MVQTRNQKCSKMSTAWSVASVVVAFVSFSSLCSGQNADQCTTPNGTSGRCVRVRKCGFALDYLRKDLAYFNDTSYLESLLCDTLDDGAPLICCPRLENGPSCGPFSNRNRITGGNDTTIGEFPWIVLLRFRARNGRVYGNCAGSLISKRFVLTAAHCFPAAKKKGWEVQSVRVAEWNHMNHRGSRDCRQLPDFNEPICRKDYAIARIAIHPAYRVNYAVHVNDIALIELVTDVELNAFVAPICLPLNGTQLGQHGDTKGREFTAAGWGATEPDSGMSDVMMQIDLREFDKERCRKVFQVPSNVGIGEGHICAGGVRGEDTCHGDSGGPLMEFVDGAWYLMGITSFGWPRCGKEGVPGVYTNVSHYIGWIEHEVFRGILA
uniref:CLIP domain-containing serine protease n=1 Tax=Anopheles farauti TaxID=69004 RepID=A0A182Q8Y8_9DIPT